MTTIEVLRAKTSYLLQTIEQSLGKYSQSKLALLENIDELSPVAPMSVKDRIAESYLSDLFGIALSASKETSDYCEVLHLKNLSESLDIYEIRNACAHPNRSFFSHYWYRIASLAQDPSFRVLGLESVSDALAKAESDSFSVPDTAWTITLRAAVPNNLPNSFEHDRTGLMGRDPLIEQINKSLVSGRFPTIALVAPGGFGKTALALELLKKLTYSVNGMHGVDLVIFISLKNERLTHEGIQVYAPQPTLDDLERELVKAFCLVMAEEIDIQDLDSLISSYGTKKVVICIDNLESVLLAHIGRASEFEQLLADFPPTWRILLTTRIPVNSAHCISIGSLSPGAGSGLARSYSRSVGLQLPQDLPNRVAQVCKSNPLAIKLTVDAISSGKSVEEALACATSGTAKFSYGLLVDTLSKSALAIIEVLFAVGTITKSDIAILLEQDSAEVANSLSTLSRTSLIYSTFEEGVERYAINDAVRELVLVHPRNIEIRSGISEKISKKTQQDEQLKIIAGRRSDYINDYYYVSDDQPSVLRDIARLIKRNGYGDVISAIEKLNIVEQDCINIDTYWILRGLALSRLRDPQAKEAYFRALEINESLRAISILAVWFRMNRRFAESAEYFIKLKCLGGCDRSVVGDVAAEKNVQDLLICVLFSEDYDGVIDLTNEFLSTGYPSQTLVRTRASAARMIYYRNQSDLMLKECCDVLNTGFNVYGYTETLAKESVKLIKDLWLVLKSGRMTGYARGLAIDFLNKNYEHVAFAVTEQMINDGWTRSNIAEFDSVVADDGSIKTVCEELRQDFASNIVALISFPCVVSNFSYPPELKYRFAVDAQHTKVYFRFEDFDGTADQWLAVLPKTDIHLVCSRESLEGRGATDADKCPKAIRVSLRPIFALTATKTGSGSLTTV